MAIDLILNGKAVALDAPPAGRLIDALRDHAGLTSVKEGCGEGECGSCTVLVDGEPVCSCLTLAGQVAGAKVETVEGLARGPDRPLVDAVVEAAGVQCGYCTPGVILAAKALLDAHETPTRNDIKTALSGNLCRCTGYHRLIDAVDKAATARRRLAGDAG
ncbi:MAG: (2Fe-2S)-binding protein [Deltaproteobacteria bacterium]|nr:(2Fe-2S)-binding protein [Deltaproteobacteria bacterium]